MTDPRRLYLWDIDGTLITSGGAGSGAMRLAFNALYKRDDGFTNIEFSGRTDRSLFREALAVAGLADGADFPAALKRFKRAYKRRLYSTLEACDGRILPGVFQILDLLAADPDATQAVGTGNFKSTAAVKLGYYKLADYFQTGGFGDNTDDRAELIAAGARSAERMSGHKFGTVFVIGDTIHDITSAKANNFVAVGVATGTTSAEALGQAGADVVLPDLLSAAQTLIRRD